MPLLICLGLFIVGPASAQEEPRSLREVFNEGITAYQTQDYETFLSAMLEAEEARPYQLAVTYNVALGYALTGRTDEALTQLELIAAQGLVVPLDADDDLASLEGIARFEAVRERIADNDTAFGSSDLLFAFDIEGVLAEGLAVDEVTGDTYLSTVRTGEVWRITPDGTREIFLAADAHTDTAGLFGMAVDNARGLLWVTSSPADPYRGPHHEVLPRSALFGLDLETGEVRAHYPVPGEQFAFLGEVVLNPAGDVYVSDSLDPVIYRLDEEAGTLVAAISSPLTTNLQGFDFAPDGRVYIADYVHGLFVYDPATDETSRLAHDPTVNLTGTDGLFWFRGDLIGTQNGIRPHQIVRVDLTEDGTGVENVELLARNLEGWMEPTLGQIVDGRLIYTASSGWPLFGAGGEPVEGEALPPVRIMSLPLQ